MRVVCMSDLHGSLPDVPECDVLVLAGDICPDAPRALFGDPDLAGQWQKEWLETDFHEWEHSWPASVKVSLATPGNHDWIRQFPSKCRTRMYIDEELNVYGRRFWFTPWVSYCGPWNYQLERKERMVQYASIPYRVDMLVTHSPAYGIGDQSYGNPGELCGCQALRDAIHVKQPRFHVFGHIHEGQRFGREFRIGGTKSFNVAKWGVSWKPLLLTLPRGRIEEDTKKFVDIPAKPC